MAARFWNKQNALATWSAAAPTNWGSVSGGTGAAAPTSSDDVTFDGVGTGGTANSTCTGGTILSLTFTSGYTGTVTINTGVSLAITTGGLTDNTAHSWSTSGTANLNFITNGQTITSNGKVFSGNVNVSNGITLTLSGAWSIGGALTGSNSTFTLNSGALTVAGGYTGGVSSQGTSLITLTGGTWSCTVPIKNDMTIAGNVTVSGSVAYNTGTLTYSSGTVTTTSSTLIVGLGTTWNTNGITWNNVTITSGTQTLNSALTVGATLTISGTTTFAGASGFTTATFTCSATGVVTLTFANGVTYTITAAMNAFTSRTGSIVLFTSDHATNTAAITLQNGATCSVLADFTRINASGGRTINTFHGTLTGTTNIFSYTDYGGGIASSYIFC